MAQPGQDFKALSVSSENWVPFEFVPPEKLVAYLRQKRLEGFSILGLEQV
jgi:hypothetical protein